MSAQGGRGKRRAHGEGTMYYSQAAGRWIAYVDLGTGPDGKRKRRKVERKRQADALEAMRTLEQERDNGADVSARSARDTVSALAADYWARGLPASARAAKTHEGYRSVLFDHLEPALGGRKLAELSADDVDRWLQGKAAAGYSRATLAHLYGVTRRMLRWGVRRGRLGSNVCDVVDIPDAERRQSRALDVEQAQALARAARTDRLAALWLLGLAVPSRPGELTGLCWSDVDLDSGVVTFSRALQHDHTGAQWLGELKTSASRRAVEVPAFVLEALRERRRAEAAERLAAGATWQEYAAEHGGLVFTAEQGGPVDPANLRRALRRVARDAETHHRDEQAECECMTIRRRGPNRHTCGGEHLCDARCLSLPAQFSPRELRHTAVSLLSHGGVALEDIADVAGHANPSVTGSVYRHNLAPVLRHARGVMDGMLGAESGEQEAR